MRHSKILAILLLFFVLGLIQSCMCRFEGPSKTSYKSVELFQLDKDYLIEIIGKFKNPMDFRDDFGFRIFFNMNWFASACQTPNSFFIQSAYACTPASALLQDTVISINFFSNKNIGETYPAGSDITSFFRVAYRYFNFPSDVPFYEPLSFFFYLNRTHQGEGGLRVMTCVMRAIDIVPGEYEFTVVIGLSDGRELKASIKAILE